MGSLWSSLGDIFANMIVFFYSFTHNYGIAIILMTVLIRVILYPLMQKQMVSMREMQKIQPLMKEVQAKYKNDKERLNKELMALYKEHKVNPMSGCLPLLIQMPILILLFQVLRNFNEKIYSVYNGDPGFLWLKDLSLPDQLIQLPGSGIFGIQYIGIMPFLIGGSMYIQQKMTSTDGTTGKDGGSAQQTQKMFTLMMPLMIGFFSFSLPSGLTLYWLTSTLLGIGQQYLINKKMPAIDEMPKEVVPGKKEKPSNKKPEKTVPIKEEPWIPGYEKVTEKNPFKGKKKSKKYKKGKKRYK